MSVLKPLAPIASAALLLAAAGCTMERKDDWTASAPAAASAATVMEPAAGHEIHMMFDAPKRSAQAAELPAQF